MAHCCVKWRVVIIPDGPARNQIASNLDINQLRLARNVGWAGYNERHWESDTCAKIIVMPKSHRVHVESHSKPLRERFKLSDRYLADFQRVCDQVGILDRDSDANRMASY